MISKELMSEVLGYRVLSNILIQEEIIIKLNFEYFQTKYENDEINIYELAYKCKEWACKKGYSIISISDFDIRHDTIDNYDKYYFTAYINMNLFPELNKKEYTHLHDINSSTEPEAIFKACQWILDNKQKGKI